jgi:hypothetical protein
MLYEIHKSAKKPPTLLKGSSLSEQGWREKKLQDYLFQHLKELVSSADLMVIGQSKPGEKADLVALDCEAELWLFELKKVGGKAENLLQVMRYSQIFSSYEIGDLDALYRENHKGSTKSLDMEFCEYFGYDTSRAPEWGEKLGKRHHLVVVTDGTDDETLASVAHWQRHGLDIQAWPYRIYKGTGHSFELDLPELFIRGKRISRKVSPVCFVNTSRGNEDAPSDIEKLMLKHECAVTACEPWIYKIYNIPAGANVMLYANRIGVIATGIATSTRRIETPPEWDGEKVHFLKLREFRPLKRPFPPQEIWRVAGYQFRMGAVTKPKEDAGQRIWEAVTKRL